MGKKKKEVKPVKPLRRKSYNSEKWHKFLQSIIMLTNIFLAQVWQLC